MLDKTQLIHMFDRLGTPLKGRELILRARTEAPVRSVESRGGNVITLLSSRKMGREIRTESRHIEFAAAVDHEYDLQVLEFYAQPTKLNLELIDDATGEIKDIVHFPDFLVVTADGFTLEEWKSEQKLLRLAEKYPYRYVRRSDGSWHSPQIEKQLAELGIRYRICSGAGLSARRVENYLFLADYFHPATEPCPQAVVERLQAVLRLNGDAYIHELLGEPYGFQADDLYKAIADRQVVANLDHEALSAPRRCRVYRDSTLRDFMTAQVKAEHVPGQEKFVVDIAPGAVFRYESQELTLTLVGEKDVVVSSSDGSTRTLGKDWLLTAIDQEQVVAVRSAQASTLDITRYTQVELDIALQRQAILQSDVSNVGISERTLRRWAARQSAAMVNGANEVLVLVPNTSGRGNRTPRLSEQQSDMLQRIYEKEWRHHKAQNLKSCFRLLQVACDVEGVKSPSYPSLIQYIKSRETNQDQRLRHGKRMAYQLDTFVDVLYADTPVHGSRPFQYVHIDHTQIDIEVISSRTGKALGRPWLSLAVDAWSRRIVGFYLTFDPPSYHSVMMTIRDMVRRFGRLPEFIVVDNGRDFASYAFETFLRVMGVHQRYRPAGHPRHGAVLERMFGRLHTEFIHNLAGNTKATKNVRMTTGKHLPVNFAEWTLEALYYGIEYWATEFYDEERHVALDCSPRDAFMRGLRESGSRPQRRIKFNQEFLIATCPPVDRAAIRQVHGQRGVKVNSQLYWNAEFSDPRVAGQLLPVRYDPWDASSVYVGIQARWVHAQCRNLIGLGQLTEMERRVLTEEYTNQSGDVGDDERSRQRLYEFMQTFKPEGAMEAAFERQSENKALYNDLQLSNINPIAGPRKICLIEEEPQVSAPVAEDRPYPTHSSDKPAEAQAEDQLPDFDVF